MAVLGAGCGTRSAPVEPSAAAAVDSPTTASAVVTSTAARAVGPTTTSPPSSAVAAPAVASTPDEVAQKMTPNFESSINEIDDALAARMSTSWRPGCPVGLADLRYLTVSHFDYTGSVTSGELVLHRDHAEAMVEVFEALYNEAFPIERMELVDEFDADDNASMVANNTSAFNCREIDGSPGVWSNHAFGRAIDINPLVNPWVTDRGVFPVEGTPFADRSNRVQGGIYPGDSIVDEFADIGWSWGGNWSSSKDWQHFDVR